ncbi:tyrosine-tRNA ligase [Cryptococcus sp. DSM 104549]
MLSIALAPLARRPTPSTRRLARLLRHSHSQSSKTVLQELRERGFVAAVTSENLQQHVQSPTTIYGGVDPSASSLHVGNLLPLLALLHFQVRGHQSICLIGGATGSIGDPSGRSTERDALATDQLSLNVAGITSQAHRFFERGEAYLQKRGVQIVNKGTGKEGAGVNVVNNLDWTKGVSLLDFLRTVGKMTRVSTMLARDSVKNRLSSDSGISYTEFSYQLLQAFDFYHLHENHGCKIQLGGSDQWGNIVAGVELIRRTKTKAREVQAIKEGKELSTIEEDPEAQAYGLTIPLLTTSTGEKFGKSAGNAVWLDEERTSPSEFYQFFLRTTDEDVEKYLRLFTFVPVEEIQSAMEKHQSARSDRGPQKLLAAEVTELVHGPEAVSRALAAASILYSTPTASLRSADVLSAFAGDSRCHHVPLGELTDVSIGKIAATYGLCSSQGQASRLIKNGGLTFNDRKFSDVRDKISVSDLADQHVGILRAGNKKQVVFYAE